MSHPIWRATIDLLYRVCGTPREPSPSLLCWYLPDDRLHVSICKSTYTLTVMARYADGHMLAEACGLRLPKVYPIAYGENADGADKQAVGDRRTPEGEFRICQKLRLARPQGPFGGHWMRLDTRRQGWEGIGLHGTNKLHSIGTRATAGCIRLHNEHIAQLYRLLPLGTLVEIVA